MSTRNLFLILLIGAIAGILTFFTLTGKKNCLLLTNSQYFDSATSGYLTDRIIIVRKEKITDIVSAANSDALLKEQSECATIDLAGKFLFPGFTDAHTHLFAFDSQRVSGWKTALELSASRAGMTRFFIGEKNAKSMLLAGFTTVRDLGNSGNFLDSELKQKAGTSSALLSEIVTSGPGIAVSPSQIDLRFNRLEYRVVDEKTEVDTLLQEYVQKKVSWIKLYADNSVEGTGLSQQLLRSITERAHLLKLKVAVHAIYKESIQSALSVGADSIEHFDEIPDYDLPVSVQLPFAVPTDFSLRTCRTAGVETNCFARIESMKARLKWLQLHNFRLVFGSDSVLDFTSKFRSRGEASLSALINLAQLGLTPTEALLSATATAGEMLALNIGKIEKGYSSDFVAFSEDPLLGLEALSARILVISKGNIVCKTADECQL